MNAERFERVRDLFLLLRDMPEPDAAAALSERCGGDDELRAEVESLLDTHRESGTGSHVVDRPLVGGRLAKAVAAGGFADSG